MNAVHPWSPASLSRAAALAAAAAIAIACAPSGEQAADGTSADTEAAAQAIRDLSSQWLQAEHDRDTAAIVAMFGPEAVVYREGEQPVVGPEAIRADIVDDWAENPDFTVDWTTDRVEVAESGDFAVEYGSWTFDPDGEGEAGQEKGKYVTVWTKTDAGWKVMSDIGVGTGGGEGSSSSSAESGA